MAPLNGTDEFSHFPRVYQITQGTFWEKSLPNQQYGGNLPTNINNMINDYRDLSRKSSPQIYEQRKEQLQKTYSSTRLVGASHTSAIFTSVSAYPPWAYVPSVIGVLIAKATSLPLIWYVYLGRLFTLAVWICLTALAIKLLPSGKWFLVAIALLPTSITQAATISSDGLVNGLSWLVLAFTLAILARKITLTWSKLILLTIAGLSVCIIKDAYWLIGAFPLIIPVEYFASKTQAWLWRAASFITIFVGSVWFTMHSSKIVNSTVLTPYLNTYINSKAQLHFLLHHTLFFLGHVLIQPFTKNFDTVYLGVVGIITNRLVYLSIALIGLLYGILFLSLSEVRKVPELVKQRKRLLISAMVIIVGTYLFIAVAFYLAETQVGASTVASVYGRYFLPLIPFLVIFPLTTSLGIKIRVSKISYPIALIIFIGLVSTLFSIG